MQRWFANIKTRLRETFTLCVLCLAALLCATEEEPRPAVLQLQGKPGGRRPDILFLAPQLTKPAKSYKKAIRLMEERGTLLTNATLSMEDFHSMGLFPVLKAADYRQLQVRDVPWQDACKRLAEILALRRKSRIEDKIEQQPLCAFLTEEATPQEIADSLPALLDSEALIFFAPQPQSSDLPLTLVWTNVIRPGYEDPQNIHLDHWIPTLAEIVGLPNPAEVPEPSLLPMLTGVGFQRPLEASIIQMPPRSNTRTFTMLSHYATLPEELPWVPDYTCDEELKPTTRLFLPSELPIPTTLLKKVKLEPREQAQGLYLRTKQATLALTIPAGVSCVIRVKGRTVFSEWQPAEAVTWKMNYPSEVSLELFFVLPADCDPLTLPIFEVRDEPMEDEPETSLETPQAKETE